MPQYPQVVLSPQDAAYNPVPVTSGTPFKAARGIAADISSPGTVTLTLSNGQSMSWTVAPGHQFVPYNVVGFTNSGSAVGNFYALY